LPAGLPDVDAKPEPKISRREDGSFVIDGFRPPLFMVGQDRRGYWVVQDQKGTRGGLFVNRDAALRFVRSENGFKAQAVVMVSGGIELDMNRNAAAPNRPESTPENRRRIAWQMSITGRHVSKLSGYAPALPTPFNDAGCIDADALERLCDLQLAHGATTFVVCGTTGEAPTLSRQEHKVAWRSLGRAAGFRSSPEPARMRRRTPSN
jgi:Dihydrodipicolinate synthetase family